MSDVPKPTDRETSDPISIGRIPLKQVRVSRQGQSESAKPPANPMNRLVPYLDLFARLDDAALSRLAEVEQDVVAALRQQVVAIDRALAAYADLLPRLSDTELVRLTGASEKTIRFWRLCQPRSSPRHASGSRSERQAPAGAPSARATTAATPGGGVSAVAGEDGGSAADSQPSGDLSGVEQSVGDTGPHPIATRTPDVSRYMTFSGEPFPGFDASAEAAAEVARLSGHLGSSDDDPLSGL